MGGKISIDSATLMNKGLELIEAHHLFGSALRRIDVVVHPQSLIHSLIHLVDGSTLAHLGNPDMRVPIAYALHGPERIELPVEPLDLAAVGELTFEEPDTETFPACASRARPARRAGPPPASSTPPTRSRSGPSSTASSPSPGSPTVVERVLEAVPAPAPTHFEDLFDCDAEARGRAGAELSSLSAAGNGRAG